MGTIPIHVKIEGATVRQMLMSQSCHTPFRFVSRVELSTKVLDEPSKLQRTLCHELCHVATWLLDHVAKPPHGPHFKAWAAAAMTVYPYLDITTCHSYDIHFAWRWQCTNPQ